MVGTSLRRTESGQLPPRAPPADDRAAPQPAAFAPALAQPQRTGRNLSRAQLLERAATRHLAPRGVKRSTLPENLGRLERNYRVTVMRDDAHRVVTGGAAGGDLDLVEAAVGGARERARAVHRRHHRRAASEAIGIQFDTHRSRVELAEVHLRTKAVPPVRALDV